MSTSLKRDERSSIRRWTLSHDATAEDDRPQAFRVRGPDIAFGSVEVMPVSEHEAAMEILKAACRHTVMHCSCQPSGQTCDRCHPAMRALALLHTTTGSEENDG